MSAFSSFPMQPNIKQVLCVFVDSAEISVDI